MKNSIFKLLFFTTLTIISFSSCNDDDDSSSGSGDEFLTAKIDGSDFKASTSPATIIGATISNGILAVQGGDNSGNTISLQISSYNGIGTYKTGDNISNTNQIMYLTISPVASWASNLATAALGTLTPGTIEITSEDGTTIEGTFSFEGYNADNKTMKSITVGEFKAQLQ